MGTAPAAYQLSVQAQAAKFLWVKLDRTVAAVACYTRNLATLEHDGAG
jgi:hypothetical protein